MIQNKETTIQKGRRGEREAEEMLKKNGWIILQRGTRQSSYDLRIQKYEGEVIAVNVKKGSDNYGMHKLNLERLLKHCAITGDIPAYLFLVKDGYALFVMEDVSCKNIKLVGEEVEEFHKNWDLTAVRKTEKD